MKTFNSNQSFINIDENDVLYIKGSIGTIILREDQYGAKFIDGVWHISVDEEVFNNEIEVLKNKKK